MTAFAQMMAMFLHVLMCMAGVLSLWIIKWQLITQTQIRGYWDLYCQKQAGFTHSFRTQCFLIWYFSSSNVSHIATPATQCSYLGVTMCCPLLCQVPRPISSPKGLGEPGFSVLPWNSAGTFHCSPIPSSLPLHMVVMQCYSSWRCQKFFCKISTENSDYWSNPKLMCHNCV